MPAPETTETHDRWLRKTFIRLGLFYAASLAIGLALPSNTTEAKGDSNHWKVGKVENVWLYKPFVTNLIHKTGYFTVKVCDDSNEIKENLFGSRNSEDYHQVINHIDYCHGHVEEIDLPIDQEENPVRAQIIVIEEDSDSKIHKIDPDCKAAVAGNFSFTNCEY